MGTGEPREVQSAKKLPAWLVGLLIVLLEYALNYLRQEDE